IADTTPPLSAITNPITASHLTTVANIQGNAQDPNHPFESNISSVQVQVSYLKAGDTYYWDGGTSFSSITVNANTAWFDANYTKLYYSSGSWVYSGVTWPSDLTFTIKSRGIDSTLPTNNLEVPPSNRWISVVIDTTVPQSFINQPAATVLSSLATISG